MAGVLLRIWSSNKQQATDLRPRTRTRSLYLQAVCLTENYAWEDLANI